MLYCACARRELRHTARHGVRTRVEGRHSLAIDIAGSRVVSCVARGGMFKYVLWNF